MIDEQAQRFVDNFKSRIASQGIPYEQYLKMTGMDDAAMLAEAKTPAEQQVRMDLAIGAIVKAEKIEVSEEEIEAKYQSMAEQYGMDVEMLKKYIDAPSMYQQLMNDKAIAVVVDNAKPVKPAAKKAAKKAEEGEAAEATEKAEKPAKKPAAKKTAKKAE